MAAINPQTLCLLRELTRAPPPTEDAWYTAWTALLTSLFPSAQGYFVSPTRRLLSRGSPQSCIPDFYVEVRRWDGQRLGEGRIVLVIEIKKTNAWQSGIPALLRQLDYQLDASFDVSARSSVYWIAVIGPHWCYGIKEDNGQEPRQLIPWRQKTHSQRSLHDFNILAGLIAAM